MNRRTFLKGMAVMGGSLAVPSFVMSSDKSPEDIFEERLRRGEVIEGENFEFYRTININGPCTIKRCNINFHSDNGFNVTSGHCYFESLRIMTV